MVVVYRLLWEISDTLQKPMFPSLGYSHDQLINSWMIWFLLCFTHSIPPRPPKKKEKKKITVEQITTNYHILSFINISVGSSENTATKAHSRPRNKHIAMLSSSPWALRECSHPRAATCLAVTPGSFALVSRGLSHGCRLKSTLAPYPSGPDSLSLPRSPSGCAFPVQPLADLW